MLRVLISNLVCDVCCYVADALFCPCCLACVLLQISEFFLSWLSGWKVNSATVLNRIAVPTYVINARDDPFFDHESGGKFPTANQIGDAPVLLNVTEHGGHCGFLDKEAFQSKGPCYFQREFARFFAHVRDGTPRQDSARGESKLSTQSLPLETGLDTS